MESTENVEGRPEEPITDKEDAVARPLPVSPEEVLSSELQEERLKARHLVRERTIVFLKERELAKVDAEHLRSEKFDPARFISLSPGLRTSFVHLIAQIVLQYVCSTTDPTTSTKCRVQLSGWCKGYLQQVLKLLDVPPSGCVTDILDALEGWANGEVPHSWPTTKPPATAGSLPPLGLSQPSGAPESTGIADTGAISSASTPRNATGVGGHLVVRNNIETPTRRRATITRESLYIVESSVISLCQLVDPDPAKMCFLALCEQWLSHGAGFDSARERLADEAQLDPAARELIGAEIGLSSWNPELRAERGEGLAPDPCRTDLGNNEGKNALRREIASAKGDIFGFGVNREAIRNSDERLKGGFGTEASREAPDQPEGQFDGLFGFDGLNGRYGRVNDLENRLRQRSARDEMTRDPIGKGHEPVDELGSRQDVFVGHVVLLRDLFVHCILSSRFDARIHETFRRLAVCLDIRPYALILAAQREIIQDLVGSMQKEASESARAKTIRRLKVAGVAAGIGTLTALTAGLAAPAIAAGFGALGIAGTGGAAAFLATTGGYATVASVFGAGTAGLTGWKFSKRVGKLRVFEFERLGRRNGVASAGNHLAVRETDSQFQGQNDRAASYPFPSGEVGPELSETGAQRRDNGRIELTYCTPTYAREEPVPRKDPEDTSSQLSDSDDSEDILFDARRHSSHFLLSESEPILRRSSKHRSLKRKEVPTLSSHPQSSAIDQQSVIPHSDDVSLSSHIGHSGGPPSPTCLASQPPIGAATVSSSLPSDSDTLLKRAQDFWFWGRRSEPSSAKAVPPKKPKEERHRGVSSLQSEGTAGRAEDLPGTPPLAPVLTLTICVSGWLRTDQDIYKPWEEICGEATDAYALKWDPSILLDLGNFLIGVLSQKFAVSAAQLWLQYTVAGALSAALMWPVALIQYAATLDNTWIACRERAVQAGRLLAEALCDKKAIGTRPVTLIGYSMGARVIYYCLQELHRRSAFHLVADVVLLGTPTSCDKAKWKRAREVVSGRLVNVYCRSDWLLGFLFRYMEWGVTVAGLSPVKVLGVENVDATGLVKSHAQYADRAQDVLAYIGLHAVPRLSHGAVSAPSVNSSSQH